MRVLYRNRDWGPLAQGMTSTWPRSGLEATSRGLLAEFGAIKGIFALLEPEKLVCPARLFVRILTAAPPHARLAKCCIASHDTPADVAPPFCAWR